MSNLMACVDAEDGRVGLEEFENMFFLFSVAGNETLCNGIGAHLARVQMRAMFSAVLDLLGELEPAGDPVRLRSNFQNGIKSLPVRWSPSKSPCVKKVTGHR
jgi:cytochrome P450